MPKLVYAIIARHLVRNAVMLHHLLAQAAAKHTIFWPQRKGRFARLHVHLDYLLILKQIIALNALNARKVPLSLGAAMA